MRIVGDMEVYMVMDKGVDTVMDVEGGGHGEELGGGHGGEHLEDGGGHGSLIW